MSGELQDGLLVPGGQLGVALTRDEVVAVLGAAFGLPLTAGDLADRIVGAQVRKLSESDSNLVRHATVELERAGNDDGFNATLIAAVHAFSTYGHSGGSAAVAADMLGRLLRFRALTPLTDDPAEWRQVDSGSAEPWWQNQRQGSCFSHDGGRTFWDLDDESDDGFGGRVMHRSMPVAQRS